MCCSPPVLALPSSPSQKKKKKKISRYICKRTSGLHHEPRRSSSCLSQVRSHPSSLAFSCDFILIELWTRDFILIERWGLFSEGLFSSHEGFTVLWNSFAVYGFRILFRYSRFFVCRIIFELEFYDNFNYCLQTT